mmetsp:Transcript_1166/g.4304  ORF Transcript_1166/g.4304 Transcript_1166/m.4304 type:complete len:296 (+) Transcript_1166:757-1644(+)
MDGVDTVAAEGDLGGKERSVGNLGLDVRAFDNVGFAILRAQAGIGEQSTGIRHGKRGRTLTRLGGDNFSTAVLGALGQRVDVGGAQVGRLRRRLREQRQDGHASVATDNRHVASRGFQTSLFSIERLRAHDVERGDAKQLASVVLALLLQHFRRNWHRGVHRVGNHVNHRTRAVIRDRLHQSLHDTTVNRKQIIARHPRLARHARRNDHHISILQRRTELRIARVTLHLRSRVHVRHIRGDTGRTRDIVQRQLRHERVHLHQQPARLSDAPSGAEHRNLVPARVLRARKGFRRLF